MDNPKISMIVPVYNKEAYLEKCVRSLLDQTYQNIEIILVDDGSEDASLSICRRLAEENARITLIECGENIGVSAARNRGIDAATGDFIGFTDADDCTENEMLARLLAPFLEDETTDLTSCGYRFTYLSDSLSAEKVAPQDFRCSRKETLIMLFDRSRNHHFKGYNVNKLYRAEIIRNRRIRFDSRVKYGEDLKFNFDYMQHIRSCTVVAYCGYHYFLNENSATYTTLATLENEDEDLIAFYLAQTEDPEIRRYIMKWALIYYRSIMYECYQKRIPARMKKHVSRFFRENEAYYLKSGMLSKKETLFVLSLSRCEPFYHLTQLRKGE